MAAPTYAKDGLTLSPLRTEAELTPGMPVKGSLKVTNGTDAPMTVRMSAEAFRVINKAYNYNFDDRAEIIKWVQFKQPMITLEPRQSQQVIYTITVPPGSKSGGNYISMFATTEVRSNDDAIKTRQRVGSLFYLTVVGGEIKRGGVLSSIYLPWLTSGDSRWSFNVKNEETTHFHSKYDLAVYNVIGNKKTYSRTGDTLIMPATERQIEGVLPAPDVPGIYKIVATIGLGDNPSRQETRFLIYAPAWVMLTGLSLIVVLVGIVITRKYYKKRRN